jgi:hypothetical protein
VAGNSLIQVKKKGFSLSIYSRYEHCIQVRMIPGKLVAVLEKELIAGAHDKDTALLPEIAICAALAETLSHGLDAVN